MCSRGDGGSESGWIQIFNATISVTSLVAGTVYLRPALVGQVEAIVLKIKN
jgi:hypothetical protein